MTIANRTPANHIACQAGDGNVRRGEAVIRSNGREQLGWHKDCYTVHRATKDLDVPAIESASHSAPLSERLARAGLR